MDKNDILAALPQSAVKDQWANKAMFVRAALVPAYKDTIRRGITSVQWLGTIVPSCELHAHVSREREYREISINIVSTPSKCDTKILAEALHSVIPNPTVLFFARDENIIEVSVAHKAVSKEMLCNHMISGEINLCPLPVDPKHQIHTQFVDSIRWENLPKKDLFDLYQGWYARVTALKVYCLTNTYRIATSQIEASRQQALLAGYVKHHSSRRMHRRELQDMFSPSERADVEQKIAADQESIDKIKEILQLPPGALESYEIFSNSTEADAAAPRFEAATDPSLGPKGMPDSARTAPMSLMQHSPHAIPKYRLRGGRRCLYCRSEDLVRDYPQERPILVDGTLEIAVHCGGCGERWVDRMRIDTIIRPLPESP